MNSTPDIESLPIVRGASDLHDLLPVVEPCDVLLLAGDLVPLDLQNNIELSERWLTDVFVRWLDEVPATEVVGIAGNHDFALERLADRGAHRSLLGARWTYLRDAGVTLECGLKIWGTPWSPGSSEWAFSSDEQTLADAFEGIPDHVDVLLSHTPPYGKGDRAPCRADPLVGQLKYWRHIGSKALRSAIHRASPRLVVYGHVHADGGWRIEVDQTRYSNVSVLDEDYRLVRTRASRCLRHRLHVEMPQCTWFVGVDVVPLSYQHLSHSRRTPGKSDHGSPSGVLATSHATRPLSQLI